MIHTETGTVQEIQFTDEEISKIVIDISGTSYSCINYNGVTGVAEIGDLVLVNTTALDLKLGTGGFHIVLCNLSRPKQSNLSKGHIMKLKYTPIQINCLAAEAQESEYHHMFSGFQSLNQMPVIVGTLHSMLSPCSIYIKKKRSDIKVAYIMTEGGALPIQISDSVRKLKYEGFIDTTITYGNAYGGDLETVNIYTALIAAREITMADITIVCMGPGIVGTDTKYGFSGIEQGSILDAVFKLGGLPIGIPRISFADERERHKGISHHSLTIFRDICCTKSNIVFPLLQSDTKMEYIYQQIDNNNLKGLHNIYYVDSSDIYQILQENKEHLNRMGYSFTDDSDYFVGCAASAKYAILNLD